MRASSARTLRQSPESDPLWYKDAVVYELRVGAYQDSDGDGIGDFRGLAERLDYLQDLGVTVIWLLPFCPSPLKDDGYDISDYINVHPDVGSLDDFKLFVREAHKRSLRVITELVINHTSDQHPWFQRARRSPPDSRWRNYYVWSDAPEKYAEARVIFKDFERSNWTWDPIAKAYYWHRFYAHQPDLNFDQPDVRRAVFRFLDFWLSLGVDGLRLDAVPYLYEREGTNCENLPETHVFLRTLRRHVDEKYEGRMLLAEANQWSEDAVAYFGQGDECHMAFHFPVMPRLFMALHMEDRFPIIEILTQTPEIPDTCQWALFLRNHDELTLEMVTDEERDYMYRVYANDAQARINLGIRRRLAPLLGRDRRRIELMNALLFSLPGTPVIYYGDEIGMGDNFYLGDRNGVRTPMQWSADRNAGFSHANPQRLHLPVIVDPEYHYESTNVEAQQNNPRSLLWWMKRQIAMRKRYKAFGRGTIGFLHPRNRKVLAFVRRYQEERLLIVANLSRFVQFVELDLSPCKGMVPVELFGQTPFPPISEAPYLLTLGPHSFYWFSLHPAETRGASVRAVETGVPTLRVSGTWKNIFRGHGKTAFEAMLPRFLEGRRWFGAKALGIKSATVADAVPVANGAADAYVTLITVGHADGSGQTYALPMMFAEGARAASLREHAPAAVVGNVEISGKEPAKGVLYDALEETGFCEGLLDAVARRRQFKGLAGEIVATPTRALRTLRGPADQPITATLLKAEQSNNAVVYGDRLLLKFVRRLAEGVNPELEVGRFLTERAGFTHTAPLAGALEYRAGRRYPVTLGVLQGYVVNEGDAWRYTLDQVRRYFERALAKGRGRQGASPPADDILELLEADPLPLVSDMIGAYLEMARLLGQRTAELHLALGSVADDPDFAPEPFTTLYQRALYQSMRNLTAQVFRILGERVGDLPAAVRPAARKVLGLEDRVVQAFQVLSSQKIAAMRIRCHGDYHLGQVLCTGRDFVIIDFEGEPARSLADRRLKRSPLRDVAGMLRSFDYAVYTVLLESATVAVIRPEDVPVLAPWARFWRLWVSSTFLRSYLHTMGDSALIPQSRGELDVLLKVLLLEKAVYELGYELNNRPRWAKIPLHGVLELLGAQGSRR